VRSSSSSTDNDESQSPDSPGTEARSLSQPSPQRFSSDESQQPLSQRQSQDLSLISSSQDDSASDSPDVNVRGAGTDVMAVQDAGSYRMLFDDCSYLCSTIVGGSPTSALEAACDLALLLSERKTRAILLTEGGGAALTAILEAVSSVSEPSQLDLDGILGIYKRDYESLCLSDKILFPDGKIQGIPKRLTKNGRKRALEEKPEKAIGVVKIQRPRQRSLNEALASVVHFLSWDCTTSQHASTGSASAARKVRSAILEHPNALRGICHFVLMDPIAQEILSMTVKEAEIAGRAMVGHDSVIGECSMPYEKNGEEGNGDCDDASRASSIDTNESVSSSQGDPTCSGRRKRRKKRRILLGRSEPRLDVITEDEVRVDLESPMKLPAAHVGLCMSFTSEEETPRQKRHCDDASVSTMANLLEDFSEKLVEVRAALVQQGDDNRKKSSSHTCKAKVAAVDDDGSRMNLFMEGDFVLQALSRIIEGKEGDEDSCIEQGADEGDQGVNSASQDSANQDEGDEEELLRRNPLLITNTLLRKSGTLPMLARAMSESLSAVIVCLGANEASCRACLEHLMHRVSLLASIIDGACCLTSENRQELCSGNSKLMPSILLVLKTFSDQANEPRSQSSSEVTLLDEIALSTLRTLTSLTHDNALAGSLLMSAYEVNVSTSGSRTPLPGVLILADLLRQTVSNSSNSDEKRSGKQLHYAYDMIIFCLNTLSNAVRAKNLLMVLAEYKVPVSSDDENTNRKGQPSSLEDEFFLTWLSRWLFNETTSFRDEVMRGTFGEKVDQGTLREMRVLEKDEEEHLITAGNGFILMTCLMIQSNVEDQQLSVKIRELMLDELQVDGGGLLLIKNTLKAFCNFYHFSLGDLSVAIVAPVGRIIAEVESMQVQSNEQSSVASSV
jgi:hypothetical protein